MSYFYPEALNAMEIMARDLFQRAYPDVSWVVRVIADSVTGTASVDWNGNPRLGGFVRVTIRMPVRKATYRMTADEFESWSAYLLHEVGHPLETSKHTWLTAVQAGKHRLLNSLEDVREEKCTILRGIAHNAKYLFSRLIDGLHAKAVAGGYNPNDVNNIGWTLSAMGRHANGYAVDISDIHARLDPNGIVGKIAPWALKDLASCASTQDCLDLASRIIDAVNAERKAERETPPDVNVLREPPQGGQNAPESDQDLQPMGEDAEEEEQAPDVGSDVPEEAPDQLQGSKATQKPEPEKEFTDADVKEPDLTPNWKENMDSNNSDANIQRYLVKILRDVEKQRFTDKVVVGRSVNGSVDVVVADASKMGLQRALLARAIKSPDNDDYDGNRRSGRLDVRALAKIPTGNANVFGKRTVVEGFDTDVQILVDASGSMSGSRIQAASTLALVIAQAASQSGVDCTAHVFNDDGLHAATKGRMKPVGRKFAYMQNQIKGGTPLTENMLKVAKEQVRRAGNKRKILFIVSDGDCDMGVDVAKAAGEYVETTMGIEIANLHIGHTAHGMFRNEVAVPVNNVSKVGLRQLTTVLERGR